MRLDIFLVTAGLAKSRTEAARLIDEGAVLYRGEVKRKPSFPIPDETLFEAVTVLSEGRRYVSRGGEKLETALSAFRLSPHDRLCIDVGASSGGFTDCLLQNGAAAVLAVDAGRGQLAPALRDDARVHVFEQYNARYLKKEDFPFVPSFAVMDVSFISATLIIPSLSALLPAGALFVLLIKPQFEVGRGGIGKGGIVKNAALREQAVLRVVEAAKESGFSHLGTIRSPLLGGDGNTEFLAAFEKE